MKRTHSTHTTCKDVRVCGHISHTSKLRFGNVEYLRTLIYGFLGFSFFCAPNEFCSGRLGVGGTAHFLLSPPSVAAHLVSGLNLPSGWANMSHMPMMSLDEREARAKERVARQLAQDGKKSGRLSSRSVASSRSSPGGAYQPPASPPRTIPRPGESLFDNYANLQDPTKFSTDEEEVEELLRMGVGWNQNSWEDERYKEAGWDASPHKNPPAYLKKLKPVTREPWTIDAQVYNAAFNQADFGKGERYGINPNPPLNIYRQDDPKKRPKGARQEWNSQPFRSVPHALKGIKPASTSTEPWVNDHNTRMYGDGGNFEDTNVIEDDTIIALDNGGEQRFKKGAFNAYKEERNRKLHAEPWDTSTRPY